MWRNFQHAVVFTGISGELWQWHTPKECDRPTYLCSAHPDPSLVMVRQDHFACRNTWMHRGRVKSLSSIFLAIVPSTLAYWSISPSISKINCAACKKKLISNGFFKKVFGCGGLLFVILYNDLKPAPNPLLSFSFLFKVWSLSFYSQGLPCCLEWTSVIYLGGVGLRVELERGCHCGFNLLPWKLLYSVTF